MTGMREEKCIMHDGNQGLFPLGHLGRGWCCGEAGLWGLTAREGANETGISPATFFARPAAPLGRKWLNWLTLGRSYQPLECLSNSNR